MTVSLSDQTDSLVGDGEKLMHASDQILTFYELQIFHTYHLSTSEPDAPYGEKCL